MKLTFKRCKICGQIVAVVNETGVPITCCGENMEVITPSKVEEALGEKHLPTYKLNKNKLTVTIGKDLHPSTKEHYISWIALVTNKGNQRKILNPLDKPIVTFMLDKDEYPLEIYSYCNIHGLWELDVNYDECGC